MLAKLYSEVGMLREAVERGGTCSSARAQGSAGDDHSFPTLPPVKKALLTQLRSVARDLVAQGLVVGNYHARQGNREHGKWPISCISVVDAFRDESMGGKPELMDHLLPGQGYLGMQPPYGASNVRPSHFPCVQCVLHLFHFLRTLVVHASGQQPYSR